MVLCIGPEGTGKTLLLRRLAHLSKPNLCLTTVPTVGLNIVTVPSPPPTTPDDPVIPPINIRELGGSMAPIWPSYYGGARRIMFVIDAANMMQLGEATLLFLELLAHPNMKSDQVAIVLNKSELPVSRSTAEMLSVMRLADLQQHVRPRILTFEVSAMAAKGLRPLLKWVHGIEEKKKK